MLKPYPLPRHRTLLIIVVLMLLILSICNHEVAFDSYWLKLKSATYFNQTSHFLRPSNFIQALDAFPWQEYVSDLSKGNLNSTWKQINDFIYLLTPFLIKEPLTPINASCQPPPIRKRAEIKCKIRALQKPRKVGILIQLGFDVDTLEIHLNEVFDVVDKFFIIESTHSHQRLHRKPLIWEMVKYQGRFSRFISKIVHFVVDDSNTALVEQIVHNSTQSDINFESEYLQERLRWTKFLEWNNSTNFFNETDILGFGDCDEITGMETINYLRHCELESDPIDVGIWFPFGSMNTALKTDFPVSGHPFTLGDPTYWTLKTAMDRFNKSKEKYPTRNRGSSISHILGGVHMSIYGYLPFLLMKSITASESSYAYLSDFQQRYMNYSLEELQRVISSEYLGDLKPRVLTLDNVPDPEKDQFAVIPWFYNCNKERYPAWEGKPDSRLN